MPNISLVICLYKERDLLERLLQQAEGCYDDLVVVHDGVEEPVPSEDIGGRRSIQSSSAINPSSFINHQSQCYEDGWMSPEELSLKEPNAPPVEIARDYAELPKDAPIPTGYRWKTGSPQPESIHELVSRYGGSFYEGPRCYQQEPHWPFAWWAATHDWILRLDADEYPSEELKNWLRSFREAEDPTNTSGFECIWPLWDGQKSLYRGAPPSRRFLLHKRRVRMFGMVEQTPEADLTFSPLPHVLEHVPRRKSVGIGNLVLRKQAYRWRMVIACCLLNSPLDLPRWRWTREGWPTGWELKRRHPLRIAAKSVSIDFLRNILFFPRHNLPIDLSAAAATSLHQCLMSLTFFSVLLTKRRSFLFRSKENSQTQ
jgi:hypothetical protein